MGLLASCTASPSFTAEGVHTKVHARDLDSAKRIGRAVDRAWERTPDQFVDPEVEHVDVTLVEDGPQEFNRVRLLTLPWGPPRPKMSLVEGSWVRAVGHEVVHARTLSKLTQVPPIILEGIAEQWAFEKGSLRDGQRALADLAVSGTQLPYAFFELGLASGGSSGFGIYSVLEGLSGPRSEAKFLSLTSEEIARLGMAKHQMAYHFAHAMVHDYLTSSACADLDGLRRLPDEQPGAYFQRTGLGSLEEVRKRASHRATGTPLLRSYWPSLVQHLDWWVQRHPQFAANPDALLEQTRATLQFKDGEKIDLTAMPEFRELFHQVWRLGGNEGG